MRFRNWEDVAGTLKGDEDEVIEAGQGRSYGERNQGIGRRE
jgi:hypothetical protein